MKNAIILTLLTLLGQALYSQTPASSNYILIGQTSESAFGGPFELSDSTVFGYDQQGRIATDTGFTWNGSSWDLDFRSQYQYDGNTNRLLEVRMLYFDGGSWDNYERTVYTYDANNHLTSILEQYHNGMGWENDERNTYTIVNGQTSVEVNEYWNGANWEQNNRMEYTYNAQGRISSYISASWNGSQWENSFKESLTYNAQGLKDTSLSFFWNGSSFDTAGRNIYTYNAAGIESQMISQYPGIMGTWTTLSTSTTTFNGNNQPLKKVTLNIFNGITEYVDSTAYDYDAQNNLYQESIFYANNGILEPAERYRYYYKATGAVGVDQVNTPLAWNIYPNPTAETLQVTLATGEATISILNMNGQQLLQQTAQAGNNQLDLTALQPGMYIVTLTQGTTRTTATFIKQ